MPRLVVLMAQVAEQLLQPLDARQHVAQRLRDRGDPPLQRRHAAAGLRAHGRHGGSPTQQGLKGGSRTRELALRRRHHLAAQHLDQRLGLERDLLDVALQIDVEAASELTLAEDAECGQESVMLRITHRLDHCRRSGDIRQPAACRLDLPFLAVSVALEPDRRGLDEHLAQELEHRLVARPAGVDLGLETSRHLAQRVGHRGVEHRHGPRAVRGAAHRPVLELVPGKGERRGAVAVGVVTGESRQLGHSHVEHEVLRVLAGLAAHKRAMHVLRQ